MKKLNPIRLGFMLITFLASYRRMARLKRKLYTLGKRAQTEQIVMDYVYSFRHGSGFYINTKVGAVFHISASYERAPIDYAMRLFSGGNCLFIDVGAFLGAYSVLAAQMGCRVLAFEPNPLTAVLLRNNLEAAKVKERVTLIQKGLWDKEGSSLLALRGGISSLTQAHQILFPTKQKIVYTPIELTTLDKIYSERRELFEGRRVIMKVDVEGAALRVVRGALETIKETRPHVIFEVHRGEGEDDELRAVPYFLKMGYRWRVLEYRRPLNFILALEPPASM
ncbi:MAG: FkbM family methyltransferase [Acidilobaceae archaeon]|nr:FkbM family methyltransferase [Acidilobaceae archaeon]